MTISVYIPTRNRAELLLAAVRSVLKQTYVDLELIVVDDASNDGTESLLSSLRYEDKRIRILRNDSPRGAPATRNRAIAAATGEFITGLDDDDTFEPERLGALQDCWNLFGRRGVSASCLYTQDIFLSDGKELFVTKKRGSVQLADLAEANHIGNQVFAPICVFREAGSFDESLPAWQDFEFFMRIVKRFGPARLLDMPLYRFDVSPSRDRISSKHERVRSAYQLVSKKHFADDRRARQQLMLQMFTSFYGIRPTAKDIAHFAALGFWPRGLVAVSKRMFWL